MDKNKIREIVDHIEDLDHYLSDPHSYADWISDWFDPPVPDDVYNKVYREAKKRRD